MHILADEEYNLKEINLIFLCHITECSYCSAIV